MKKDLNNLTKKELYKTLDEIENTIKKREEKTKLKESKTSNYLDKAKAIKKIEEKLVVQKEKLLNIKDFEENELKETETFLTQEKYIESKLVLEKISYQPIINKERNPKKSFWLCNISIIIFYNIMLFPRLWGMNYYKKYAILDMLKMNVERKYL